MPRAKPAEYVIGVDLGQARDYTAIAVVERREADETAYTVWHLERLPLGTSYLAVPPKVRAIGQRLVQRQVELDLASSGRAGVARPDIWLTVDQTGVGAAVVDLLRDAGLDPIAITITGGDAVGRDRGKLRVPKRDLAGVVNVLLQGRRLKIAAALPDADVLRRELENFRVKIGPTGHDVYGAGDEWRVGNHDDLVLAVAMALWYGEHELGSLMSLEALAPYIADTPAVANW